MYKCEDFVMYRSTKNYENQQKMIFDGLRKKNKAEVTDKLIKRGKQ